MGLGIDAVRFGCGATGIGLPREVVGTALADLIGQNVKKQPFGARRDAAWLHASRKPETDVFRAQMLLCAHG